MIVLLQLLYMYLMCVVNEAHILTSTSCKFIPSTLILLFFYRMLLYLLLWGQLELERYRYTYGKFVHLYTDLNLYIKLHITVEFTCIY